MIGIDPDKTISPTMDQKRVANQQKTDKNEFKNLFQQAVDSAKTENKTVASTPSVSEIRPVQFETQADASTGMVVDQVGRLMNTMEAYQRRLMESDATLKDIEPIVEKIAKQSESLSAIACDTNMEDELKSIVNQSLSLSSKEIARYRSGYYND
jgi:hypothetical protein